MKADLIKALATTYYLVTGKNPDNVLKTALIDELDQYPPKHVLHALNRCKRECKGFLPLAEIIDRMPSSRPSPSEAWAMIPKTEYESCVWTDEMREAYGAAQELLRDGDRVAARMAFIQAYERISGDRAHLQPRYSFSPGIDKQHRIDTLKIAYDKKQLSYEQVEKFLPWDICTDQQLESFQGETPQLTSGEFKPDFSSLIKSLDDLD